MAAASTSIDSFEEALSNPGIERPRRRPLPFDRLREYPKPYNEETITDEERWAKVGRAFDDYDLKMIESAKGGIDSLLVFAGLFSAVLTAFNVISFALLQDDPTDSTPLILAQISQQLANLTNSEGHITSVVPSYVPSGRFRASAASIAVNILWFTSLILSLTSASMAILVKQWFQEYTDLTSSQAKEHVCIRQYRFDSLHTWRVHTISKLLPLFLQLSLLLFFIGLLVLLWTVSIPVAAFVTVPVIFWLIFWLMSTVLPSVYGDCPYKSAESTILFTLVQRTKPGLHSMLYSLYVRCMYVNAFQLNSLLWTLAHKLSGRSFGSWREREKVAVQEDMQKLAKQTMRCADEILMDEGIISHSAYLYLQTIRHPYIGSVVDELLNLFQEDENLHPGNLRWLHSSMSATMNVIKGHKMYFASFDSDDDDRWSGQTAKENLMRTFLKYCEGDNVTPNLRREFVDLPIFVDLRGLSMKLLAQYVHDISYYKKYKNVNVGLPVIDAVSKYALYKYHSNAWDTARDSNDFLSICQVCIELVIDLARSDDIICPDGSDLLDHFKELIRAFRDVLDYFRTYPFRWEGDDRIFFWLSLISRQLQWLAETYPSLESDLRECEKDIDVLNDPAFHRPMNIQYEHSHSPDTLNYALGSHESLFF